MKTNGTTQILFLSALVLIAIAVTAMVSLTANKSETSKTRPTMAQKDTGTNMTKDGVILNSLTDAERRVIINKGTEMPFTGEFYNHKSAGTYICRHCNAPLYNSGDKFESGCGWPSFDDQIPGSVKRTLDADGSRTEITCNTCGGHLGHVFEGEGFTDKNTRHCVNSISLKFVPKGETLPGAKMANDMADGNSSGMMNTSSQIAANAGPSIETAYFAGGCFWGVEHLLKNEPGVISTNVGYMNGKTKNPTYKEVCGHNTGHAEAVQVIFDPTKTNFETVAKIFFEIHDPTQMNRQGGDIGDQYRSAVFYTSDAQKATSERLIGILKNKGLKVVTEVTLADTFYPAETYHQDYYDVTGGTPYCHARVKRF